MACILTSSEVLDRVLDDEAEVSRPRCGMLHVRVWDVVGKVEIDLLIAELRA